MMKTNNKEYCVISKIYKGCVKFWCGDFFRSEEDIQKYKFEKQFCAHYIIPVSIITLINLEDIYCRRKSFKLSTLCYHICNKNLLH